MLAQAPACVERMEGRQRRSIKTPPRGRGPCSQEAGAPGVEHVCWWRGWGLRPPWPHAGSGHQGWGDSLSPSSQPMGLPLQP